MKFATILAGASIPSLAFANVRVRWSFPNAPSTGLDDTTFPMNMGKAKHERGYYFAQQYQFQGISNVGYIGFQPRPDRHGKNVFLAIFSSFEQGTTSTHPKCKSGADGGPGVSCAVEGSGDYVNTYNFSVENVSNTTWRGVMTNTVTGKSEEIGVYKLPSKAGKLRPSQVGFVEYYLWNGNPNKDCTKQPKTEITFHDPTSKTGGTGSITAVEDYGDCNGQEDFKYTHVSGGYTVNYGRV